MSVPERGNILGVNNDCYHQSNVYPNRTNCNFSDLCSALHLILVSSPLHCPTIQHYLIINPPALFNIYSLNELDNGECDFKNLKGFTHQDYAAVGELSKEVRKYFKHTLQSINKIYLFVLLRVKSVPAETLLDLQARV